MSPEPSKVDPVEVALLNAQAQRQMFEAMANRIELMICEQVEAFHKLRAVLKEHTAAIREHSEAVRNCRMNRANRTPSGMEINR